MVAPILIPGPFRFQKQLPSNSCSGISSRAVLMGSIDFIAHYNCYRLTKSQMCSVSFCKQRTLFIRCLCYTSLI